MNNLGATLTIITVTKNAGDKLKKTVDSVTRIAQEHHIEYIVKDGVSSDGSSDFLQKDSNYKDIRFICSPDSGVYDGMNQAIALARGQYIYFLNAGDLIHPACAPTKILAVLNEATSKVVYTQLFNKRDGTFIRYPSVVSRFLLYRKNLCHQSIIANRESLLAAGGFDIGFRYSADRDLLVRLANMHGIRSFRSLPLCWVIYEDNGLTSQSSARKIMYYEVKEINRRHFSFMERTLFDLIEAVTLKNLRVILIERLRGSPVYRFYRHLVSLLGF